MVVVRIATLPRSNLGKDYGGLQSRDQTGVEFVYIASSFS